jgi:hypothetical protein
MRRTGIDSEGEIYATSIRFRIASHGLTPQNELPVGSVSIARHRFIPCISVHWIVT